eukprot:460998_1
MCGVENALGFSIYGFDNFTPNSLAALKMFRAFVFLFVSLYTGSSFGALHQAGDSLKMPTICLDTRLDFDAVLEQTKDYLSTKCRAHIFGDYYQIHGVEIERKSYFRAEMIFQIHRQKNQTLNNGKLSDGKPVLKDSITIECILSKKIDINSWVVRVLRHMYAFGW